MNFNESRTCEMLDAATQSKDQSRARIATAAAATIVLQMCMTRAVGRAILSPENAELRKSFAMVREMLMLSLCETTEQVNDFVAMEKAVQADLRDLKG